MFVMTSDVYNDSDDDRDNLLRAILMFEPGGDLRDSKRFFRAGCIAGVILAAKPSWLTIDGKVQLEGVTTDVVDYGVNLMEGVTKAYNMTLSKASDTGYLEKILAWLQRQDASERFPE